MKTGTPAAIGLGLTCVDGEVVFRQRNSYFGTCPSTPAILPGIVIEVTASLACSNASFAGTLFFVISSKKERAKMRAASSATSVLQQTTVWTPALQMA